MTVSPDILTLSGTAVHTAICHLCCLKLLKFLFIKQILPVPVAARPKALVCGRSLDEIAGSNPTGGMDVSVVSVVFCQVEVSLSG